MKVPYRKFKKGFLKNLLETMKLKTDYNSDIHIGILAKNKKEFKEKLKKYFG